MGHELLNPIPLLSSERFQNLLDGLAEQYDYVIVDAAPVGVVIDAAEIAKVCDGILLVVSYNQVHRQELIDAKTSWNKRGCPILGTILNQVDYEGFANKKYYYKSHYSSYYKAYEKRQKKRRAERMTEQFWICIRMWSMEWTMVPAQKNRCGQCWTQLPPTASPHWWPPPTRHRAWREFPQERYQRHLDAAQAYCQQQGMDCGCTPVRSCCTTPCCGMRPGENGLPHAGPVRIGC